MTETEIWAGLSEVFGRFVHDSSKLSTIGRDTRIREDLAISSLDYVDILIELEEHFQVTISDSDTAQIQTVGGWVALLASKCGARSDA